jgi:hypothetical protein
LYIHTLILLPILLLAEVNLNFDRRITGHASSAILAAKSLQEPGVLLPDLQTLPPEDLLLLASQNSGRKLVRFSNSIANLGHGSAELLGEYNFQTDTVEISQVVYRSDGSSMIRGVGEIMFHREHDHWHWEDFARYEVWSVSLAGELETLVTSSDKVGYCLRDDDPLPVDPPINHGLDMQFVPDRGVYLGCGWQRQGISIGWMDTYSRNTPGQFVNLSETPDGLYALRSTVDPGNRLLELDESNNTALLFFTIRKNKLQVIGDSITPLPFAPLPTNCYLIHVNNLHLCKV